MNEGKQENANHKKAVSLIVLIVIAAAAVILAATLSMRGATDEKGGYSKTLRQNTLVYAPVTDVETARMLVVHPGAELHGFRFSADDQMLGAHVYIETWQGGKYIENSGGIVITKEDMRNKQGQILFSFGLRANQKAVDWCMAGENGVLVTFSLSLPEGFVPAAWASTALQYGVTPVPDPIAFEKQKPIILAAIAVSESGSMRGLSLEELTPQELANSYDYIQMLVCEFYEEESWLYGEVLLSAWENGKSRGEVDVTGQPARQIAQNAVQEFMQRSAAWPGRDIVTLPQAIGLRIKRSTPENNKAYEEYFAFRLEDGTPVLQSQSAMQFSEISEETFLALLESVAVVG